VEIEKDTVVHVWKWWAVGAGQGSIESSGPAVCELSKGCKPDEAQPLAAQASSAWADELAKVTSKVEVKKPKFSVRQAVVTYPARGAPRSAQTVRGIQS